MFETKSCEMVVLWLTLAVFQIVGKDVSMQSATALHSCPNVQLNKATERMGQCILQLVESVTILAIHS